MRWQHARQVIHDSYALQWRSADLFAVSGSRSRDDYGVVNQTEAGKVIMIVEALPPVTKAWLKFCYAPLQFTRREDARYLTHAFFINWLANHGAAGDRRRERAHIMAPLALVNQWHAARAYFDDRLSDGAPLRLKDRYSLSDVCRYCGLDPRNARVVIPDWQYLNGLPAQIETIGLQRIEHLVIDEKRKIKQHHITSNNIGLH